MTCHILVSNDIGIILLGTITMHFCQFSTVSLVSDKSGLHSADLCGSVGCAANW